MPKLNSRKTKAQADDHGRDLSLVSRDREELSLCWRNEVLRGELQPVHVVQSHDVTVQVGHHRGREVRVHLLGSGCQGLPLRFHLSTLRDAVHVVQGVVPV